MDSKEIVSSIGGIYDRFEVTKSARLHMARAAAVGEFLSESLKLQDRETVVAALLVHDLGDVVGFNAGVENQEIVHQMLLQVRVRKKYGSDVRDVTVRMLEELGVDEDIISLIRRQGDLYDYDSVLASSDTVVKVVCYADWRVGPYGIVGVQQRIADLIAESGRREAAVYAALGPAAIALEKQVFRNLPFAPGKINNVLVRNMMLRRRLP